MVSNIYHIKGLTCVACKYKVEHILGEIDGVKSVDADFTTGITKIVSDRNIPISKYTDVLSATNKYSISDNNAVVSIETKKDSFFSTYKPIFLVFIYISFVSFLCSNMDAMKWMQYFMAGFFLVFSFFKLLDLSGFAKSYAMYDILAKNINIWGFIYPFVELFLGIAYAISFELYITNIITLVVMSIGSIGVIISVFSKKEIRCACLGSVFNLPMSSITIIENSLMILMAILMLFF